MEVQYWQPSPGPQCGSMAASGGLLQPWSPTSARTYSEADSPYTQPSVGQENLNMDFCSLQQAVLGGSLPYSHDPYAPLSAPACGHKAKAAGQASHKPTKLTCPTKKLKLRTAANQRERKRMRTINDAFDGLRCRIPDARDDKKMSKVDTLRMAIQYIHRLSDMLHACGQEGEGEGKGAPGETRRHVPRQEKVLIRYHHSHPGNTHSTQHS